MGFAFSVIVMANLFGRGQPGWLGAVCPIAVYLKTYVRGAFMSNDTSYNFRTHCCAQGL
jgi:hypothetical protein